MAGYLIDDKAAGRLGDMLRAWEGNEIGEYREGNRLRPKAGEAPPINVVRVTGAQTGGYWPGKVQFWDNTTKAFTDGGDCRIYELNSKALTTRRYFGKLAGMDETGASQSDPKVPIYLVYSPGEVVTSITCTSGSLSVTKEKL